MPVILITDFLFYILLAFLAGGIVHICRHPETARPWRKLVARRSASLSMVVMLVYLLVALLDSLHFRPLLETANITDGVTDGATDGATADDATAPRYASEVISVLDVLLEHLRINNEKTYSSPLATHAYVKELQNTERGVEQVYPRLQFGGAHLDKPDEQHASDVLKLAGVGFAKGLLVSAVFILLLSLILARARKCTLGHAVCVVTPFVSPRDRPDACAWGTIAFTACLIFVCVAVVAELSFKYHVFGTDKVGQDVLYQAIKSIRTAVLIGTLTTLTMLPLALLLGISAGYFLGWVDDVVQYIYTTLNAIPGILLIAAAILMMNLYIDQNQESFANTAERTDIRLFFLCLILGVTSWSGLCRLLRAETLKIKSFDYIAASRALGTGHFKVLLNHILPNVMHIVLITVALDFSGLVLTEAVLSYINIGVDPAMHSWGNMINVARLEMAREPVVWWSLGASLTFMFILVLCANLFADAVRDSLDPRATQKR